MKELDLDSVWKRVKKGLVNDENKEVKEFMLDDEQPKEKK